MTVDELTYNLRALGQEMADTSSWLNKVGEEIVSSIKAVTPVDTGALKNSVSYIIKGDSLLINMLDYGVYQNYGVNGTESSEANPVEFGVQPRPSSEPFFAFKTRRFGLRPRSFFNMDTITNQVAQAFLALPTEQF